MSKFILTQDPKGPDYIFYCLGCKCDHGVWTTKRNGNYAVWQFNGDINKPTVRPSILVNSGGANPTQPVCHSFIIDGKIQYLGDCTHELAGQTIEIPEYENI